MITINQYAIDQYQRTLTTTKHHEPSLPLPHVAMALFSGMEPPPATTSFRSLFQQGTGVGPSGIPVGVVSLWTPEKTNAKPVENKRNTLENQG